MEEKKVSLEEQLKMYKAASDSARKNRTCYLSDKTVIGIRLLRRIYSEIYSKQTGVDRPLPVNKIIGMAVENMINDTLARIREEAKKSETT